MESCLSGRKDMFAKHAYWKRYQGFESLTLRSKTNSGRSVVRSSRLVWDQEVAGSNPAAPTVLVVFSKLFNGCVAQLDRAFRFSERSKLKHSLKSLVIS